MKKTITKYRFGATIEWDLEPIRSKKRHLPIATVGDFAIGASTVTIAKGTIVTAQV